MRGRRSGVGRNVPQRSPARLCVCRAPAAPFFCQSWPALLGLPLPRLTCSCRAGSVSEFCQALSLSSGEHMKSRNMHYLAAKKSAVSIFSLQ